MNAMRRLFGWVSSVSVLLLVASVGIATPALAQSRGPTVTPVKHSIPASGAVRVEVKVAHATKSGGVDPQLEGLVENLKFMGFTGFRLLQTHTDRLNPNQKTTFDIVGGRKIQVSLVSRDARAAKVRVLMFNASGKVMDTTVSIHRNRAFLIAGPSFDGGKLVLPVTVRY